MSVPCTLLRPVQKDHMGIFCGFACFPFLHMNSLERDVATTFCKGQGIEYILIKVSILKMSTF